MESIKKFFGKHKSIVDPKSAVFILFVSFLGTFYMYHFMGIEPSDILGFRDFTAESKDSYILVLEPLIEGRLYMFESPSGRCPLDFSSYNQRCYMYWCPVMAMISLPLILLFDVYLAGVSLMLALFFITCVVGCLIIYHISGDYFDNVPRWVVYVCMLVFTLNYLLPHLSIPIMSVYLIPQMGAVFFLLLGILLVNINSKRGYVPLSFLSGVCLAFVVCNRPTLSIASFIILCSYAFYLRASGTPFLKNFLVCAIGFFLVSSSILLYNLVRFDNPLEFGVSYQMNRFAADGFSKPELRNVFTGFWHYLLQPPHITLEKPHFHGVSKRNVCLRTRDEGLLCHFIKNYASRPLTVGLFSIGLVYLIPFILPVYVLPFFAFFYALAGGNPKKRLTGVGNGTVFLYSVFFSGFSAVFFLSLVRGYLFRYNHDFAHLFILASASLFFYLHSKLSPKGTKKAFIRIIVDLVFLSLSILTLYLFSTSF